MDHDDFVHPGLMSQISIREPTQGRDVRYGAQNGVSGQDRLTHAALNARIQGSAADILKLAMVNIWESGICDVIGAPHLTVHDELDGSFSDDKAGREALRELKHLMETVVKLMVPLRVDAGTGANWGSCK